MKWTVNNLRRVYQELNTKAFDGMLPNVVIKISYNTYMSFDNMKIRPCGFYDGRKQKSITLYPNNLEAGQLKETMLHEMVHLMQHIKGRKLKHGRYFFKHLNTPIHSLNILHKYHYELPLQFLRALLK